MPPITPARLRELRAKAHHLHPVVRIGQHGLTPAVIREIDVNLRAHELIKVRVFSEARDERRALLERICAAVDAAPVQQIGKLLVLWRPAPESALEDKPAESTRRNASDAKRARAGQSAFGRNKGKAMAKSTPQARRPRNPVARTAARPPPAAVGPRRPLSGTGGATRRRGRGRSA
jgi:RNA-binding protein